jgi:hypothetical protein
VSLEDSTHPTRLGRTVQTIEAFTGGAPSNGSDQTTNYNYNGIDAVTSVQAIVPGGTHQTASYLYG